MSLAYILKIQNALFSTRRAKCSTGVAGSAQLVTSKKNIISSPILSTPSASSASYEIENPKTYIEIDVPCCISSEKVCIVCRETTTRPKVPDMLRLNTYSRYNFYIPKGVRCCRDHYLNLTSYKDSFDRIIRISNTSSIPVDDFKWLLDESFKIKIKILY